MPPLSDILFGGEEGPGSGLAAAFAAQPVASGGSLISFGTPAPAPPTPYTLTAGTFNIGPSDDFYGLDVSIAMGSISPTDLDGEQITSIISHLPANPLNNEFIVTIGAIVAQSFFSTITVNGQTFDTSTATFATGGGASGWVWHGIAPFSATGNYAVDFT